MFFNCVSDLQVPTSGPANIIQIAHLFKIICYEFLWKISSIEYSIELNFFTKTHKKGILRKMSDFGSSLQNLRWALQKDLYKICAQFMCK